MKYILLSLQREISGLHFFILFLKAVILGDS